MLYLVLSLLCLSVAVTSSLIPREDAISMRNPLEETGAKWNRFDDAGAVRNPFEDVSVIRNPGKAGGAPKDDQKTELKLFWPTKQWRNGVPKLQIPKLMPTKFVSNYDKVRYEPKQGAEIRIVVENSVGVDDVSFEINKDMNI